MDFFPTFTDFEVMKGSQAIDFRLGSGEILLIDGIAYFSWVSETPNIGRGYIITKELLHDVVKDSKSDWLDPRHIKGEFNPLVSTSRWIASYFGLRLVIPIQHWFNSAVHHMSNKYSKDLTHSDFLFTTRNQTRDVFLSCFSKHVNSAVVHFFGDSCFDCLRRGRVTRLRVNVILQNKFPEVSEAQFSCKHDIFDVWGNH